MSTNLISPVSATANNTASDPSTAGQITGVAPTEGTFLTLLVAQLKNQDPLSPTDSTQFVGELAQFSSLEQLMNINTGVTAISSAVAPAATTTPADTTAAAAAAATPSSTPSTTGIDDALNNSLLNSIG
jgi:flagellar basal-body rod modification protein FlgD